jgi:hypothetical protein
MLEIFGGVQSLTFCLESDEEEENMEVQPGMNDLRNDIVWFVLLLYDGNTDFILDW